MGGVSADAVPALSIEGLHKSFGELEVLRGIDLDVAEHEVVCAHRGVGVAASPRSCAASTCSSRSTPAGSVVEGEEITAKGVKVDRIRRRIGIVFQAYNLFPHMTRARQRDARAAQGPAALARARPSATRPSCSTRFGLADKARRLPRPPLGRPAAAGRDRAGARDGAATCCCSTRSRRALDPELVAEVLDVIRELAAGGHDDGHRHPRDGLRPRHREPRLLPRRRPDPRAGPADQISLRAPRQDDTRQFLDRVIAAGRL